MVIVFQTLHAFPCFVKIAYIGGSSFFQCLFSLLFFLSNISLKLIIIILHTLCKCVLFVVFLCNSNNFRFCVFFVLFLFCIFVYHKSTKTAWPAFRLQTSVIFDFIALKYIRFGFSSIYIFISFYRDGFLSLSLCLFIAME